MSVTPCFTCSPCFTPALLLRSLSLSLSRYIYIHIYICIRIYIHAYIHMHTYIHTCIHTYVCVCACVCVCVCIHMFVCMYVCMKCIDIVSSQETLVPVRVCVLMHVGAVIRQILHRNRSDRSDGLCRLRCRWEIDGGGAACARALASSIHLHLSCQSYITCTYNVYNMFMPSLSTSRWYRYRCMLD